MKLQILASKIVKRLSDEGYTTYFAGGWVRDYLLGHPKSDIDIATEAPPEEVIRLFDRTIAIGAHFGVIMVVIEGETFEVASFRRDGLYIDGRRPESVEYSSPEEDAHRRDFTINGMFYDPLNEKVYDYVGGKEDLERKIIRAVGSPKKRFNEDRLRMIRGVRMACRFGFTIEADTKEAIREQAHTLFPSVAIERVWQELEKMLAYPHFDQAILMLYQLGLLEEFLPRLRDLGEICLKQRLESFQRFPLDCPLILYLLQMDPDAGLDLNLELCERMKVSRKDTKLVKQFHDALDLIQREKKGENSPEKIEWAQFAAGTDADLLITTVTASFSDEEQEKFLGHYAHIKLSVKDAIHRIQTKDPVVTSFILLEYGIKKGKEMGILLNEAERLAVNEGSEDESWIVEQLKKTKLWPDDA
jgi:poly(A) polymerase